MRLVIMPGYLEWIIAVNPSGEVTRKERPSMVSPWMYAPWPEAAESGIVKMELEGNTLRALLKALTDRYRQAGVNFKPINGNELDADFDVFINESHLSARESGLDTELNSDDSVKVRFLLKWDG